MRVVGLPRSGDHRTRPLPDIVAADDAGSRFALNERWRKQGNPSCGAKSRRSPELDRIKFHRLGPGLADTAAGAIGPNETVSLLREPGRAGRAEKGGGVPRCRFDLAARGKTVLADTRDPRTRWPLAKAHGKRPCAGTAACRVRGWTPRLY